MRKKRLFAAVLCAMLLMTLLPTTALAADAPHVNTGAKKVFANGIPITIEAGSTPDWSKIWYMDGTTKTYLDLDDTTTGIQDEADLSGFLIFGGASSTVVAVASVVMTGGKVQAIYGGGDDPDGDVTGSATIEIRGGGVVENVYGGGRLGNTGSTSVTIGTGAVVTEKVFGGGEGAQNFAAYGNVTGSTAVSVNGGTVGNNTFVLESANGVYGGGQYGTVGSTSVTFDGGTIYGFLCGSGLGDASQPDAGKVTGNTQVTLQSGTVQRVINPLDPRESSGGMVLGGGMLGSVAGNTNVTINGGKVTWLVFGGGMGNSSNPELGKVMGDTSIAISNGEIENNVYGSGNSGRVVGSTNVTISGGTLTAGVWGGGSNAPVGGSTTITVTGGSIGRSIFGGGQNEPVNGNSTITVSGGTVSGFVSGTGSSPPDGEVKGVKNGMLTEGVNFSPNGFDNVLGKDANSDWYAGGTVGIPAGMSIAVDAGKTMYILNGATLTNNGALTVNGTLENTGTFIHNGTIGGSGSISGGTCRTSVLKAEYIDIPAVYLYTGNEIDMSDAVKILGQPFDFVSGTWSRTIAPAPVKELGSYTATYRKAGESDLVKAFRVAEITPPVFTPPAGAYQTAQSVTLSCATPGATIRYTTDNTSPTESSTPYTGAIPVTETTTVKARAFLTGKTPSAMVSATYAIGTAPSASVPKTGDGTPLVLLCGLAVLSGAGVAICRTARKRKAEEA